MFDKQFLPLARDQAPSLAGLSDQELGQLLTQVLTEVNARNLIAADLTVLSEPPVRADLIAGPLTDEAVISALNTAFADPDCRANIESLLSPSTRTRLQATIAQEQARRTKSE
jgi:hypothetical protein